MLKKIIAATMGVALLASASMNAYANESTADESVSTDNENISTSVEAATEATTDETVESSNEMGADLRKSLKVRVSDIVNFGDRIYLYDRDENIIQADAGENLYIVGIDDENQQFRVIASEKDYAGILHLKYEDVKEPYIMSHEVLVVGDLNYDGVVDVFDMCLMRRGYIHGWDDGLKEYLADMNDDGDFTVADLVWLQKWLLGVIK